jgi:integrase
MHPGFKSKLNYDDARYFQLSLKDTAIAKARREPRVPTLDELCTVLANMAAGTAIEKRNRAVVAFILLTGARDDAVASMQMQDVNLEASEVYQDARHVRTKFSKSFPTFFFPVGKEVDAIFAEWMGYLRTEQGFGPRDPLFPATAMAPGENGAFMPVGLTRECWSTASPIRKIFKDSCAAAGLPYFNPHSVRKTLVRLGMELGLGDAGMKA